MPVNGNPQDTIAISDRGFAYGDGVFETIRLHAGKPLLLEEHLARLASGCARLAITLDKKLLDQEIDAFTPAFPAEGILKVIVTRGAGGRGYRPGNNGQTTRVLSLHPLPDYGGNKPEKGIDVFVCRQRLAFQPALAGIKHLNRLEQVLASLEWPGEQFMEGLMLDMAGNVAEGTRSNIFWAESGRLFTPALGQCGVAGIMRNYLVSRIPGTEMAETCPLERLLGADEVFFCNSVFGAWPVNTIQDDGAVTTFGTSMKTRPYTLQAQQLFSALLAT